MKNILTGRRLLFLGILLVVLTYVGIANAASQTNNAYYYPSQQTWFAQQTLAATDGSTRDNSQSQTRSSGEAPGLCIDTMNIKHYNIQVIN